MAEANKRHLESNTVRKYVLDKLLVIAAAFVLAALIFGSYLLSDAYHLPPVWVSSAGVGVLFIATVGWSFRARLRKPFFVPFLIGWLAIHILVTIWVVRLFTILSLWALYSLECWIGYAVTYWLFGLPTDIKK